MGKFTVKNLFDDIKEMFSSSIVNGNNGLSRNIMAPEVNCLGLVLCGHFSHFSAEQMQIYGIVEHSYFETMSSENRRNILRRIFTSFPQIPCIIVAHNIEPPKELIDLTREYSLPLLQTHLRTARFKFELSIYLEKKFSPLTTVHGVLVEVYGVGVLILGKSGIGKSECALELLKHGHMFVGDDVVEIMLRPGGILIGKGKELVKHHMEVRGLGIIDIRAIFGIGAIIDTTKIELVIQFEEWNSTPDRPTRDEYDRSGIEEQKTDILGIDIPKIIMSVLPGRNLSTLIEVAALNQRLKQRGYYTARQLDKKLIELMAQKKKEAESTEK